MGGFSVLPEDTVFEILSRVPAESVLECKSVSKTWRNLVQHPSFSQVHLDHLNDLGSADHDSGKPSFIYFRPRLNQKDTEYDHQFSYTEYDENLNCFGRTKRINLIPPFKYYFILGSCNGLICFHAWCDYTSFPGKPAYICNPITREYVVLPNLEAKHVLTGFGYSVSTNEYKVVSICNHGVVQVYTLGSGTGWRTVRKMDYDMLFVKQCGDFANGAIHWIGQDGVIIAFDLADEEFRKLPSPPCLPRAGKMCYIAVFGDLLCAYYRYKGRCDIWVLRKNENNQDGIWSEEFSDINVGPITLPKTGWLLCYDCREKNVYRYAPKGVSPKMLVNFGGDFKIGVPHKNTLVSLIALGEEDTKQMEEQDQVLRQKQVIISC